MVISLISTFVIGLIVGFLAKAIMPGDQGMGWLKTALLGIGGAFVAKFAGQFLNLYSAGDKAGWIASVLGAVALLFLFQRLGKK